MNHAFEREKETLSRIVGRFEERGIEKASTMFYIYLCMIGFPGFFLFFLLKNGVPALPLSSDQWTFVALIPLALGLGLFLKSSVGVYYVFDGNQITQYKASGRELRKIKIEDINECKFVSSHGSKSLQIKTKTNQMDVLLTKDLSKALKEKNAEPDAARNG